MLIVYVLLDCNDSRRWEEEASAQIIHTKEQVFKISKVDIYSGIFKV